MDQPGVVLAPDHAAGPVARAVAAAWRRVLGPAEPSIFDLLVEAPGHERALHAQRLLAAIAEATGVNLPLTAIFQAPTLPALIRMVESGHAPPAPPLVEIRAGDPTRPPLFVLPGIGGIGLDVVELTRQVCHPGRTFLCHPRGLDGASTPFRRLDQAAGYHLGNIRAVQPHGPYRLLGYSGGGLVALEIGRQAREVGESVGFLGLIDTPLPERLWPHRARTAHMAARARHHAATLCRLRPAAAFAYVRVRIAPFYWRIRRMLGITGDAWSPYRIEGLPPGVHEVWEAELDANNTLTVQRTEQTVSFFMSETGRRHYGDPRLIWPRYLAHVEFVEIPGDHSSMLFRPTVATLADEVAARMGADSVALR